jgi:hypothetical protein
VDEVSRYERRFESIRDQLPAHGCVGYHGDAPVKVQGEDVIVYDADGETHAMNARKSYYLAQYALAPVIVDRNRAYPLTVENTKRGARLVRSQGD